MIFMTNNEKIVELIGIFEKAKEKFLKDEKEIIRIDINERTLSARLMFHLQTILLEDELYREKYKTYSVDCEYNRINEIEYKILKVCEYIEKTKNFEEVDKKVYPDIIVHKRNENNNLIVIEMKKANSYIKKKENDKNRLKAMTNPRKLNNFNYILGVYFEVDTTGNNNHIIEFFVNGKEYKKS
ncbi:hypothetical protein C7Y58_05880 [Fusobacterium nucleatum subsp. nucleatum ATCC 25586]|uniref:Uncharacterized protein n=2 Tax=Fusobacteriaceae TaxID=203492 RepID=Q8RFW7_FUSNN|nr:unknown [Fusobacterium nucleatum subsp. nucleatum ATCC 25586]AVQ14998.1 hypothetical protein C7Y58_05880 [Fusobacterium nucleatum subsp. nucleatum ATCC 25586]